VKDAGIEHHHLSFKPLLLVISNSDPALVISVLGYDKREMGREYKIRVICMQLNGYSPPYLQRMLLQLEYQNHGSS